MSNPNTIAQQKTLIENIDLAPNRDNKDELVYGYLQVLLSVTCKSFRFVVHSRIFSITLTEVHSKSTTIHVT